MTAAAFRAERGFIQTKFGRIACVQRGTGDAALFPARFSAEQFQGVLERLSLYRRCVAPDFLGLGYTEVAPGQNIAPEAQLAMLVALLDALSIFERGSRRE